MHLQEHSHHVLGPELGGVVQRRVAQVVASVDASANGGRDWVALLDRQYDVQARFITLIHLLLSVPAEKSFALYSYVWLSRFSSHGC